MGGLAGAVGLAALGPAACAAESPLKIYSSDYRAERKAFRTRLLRTGPSPQPGVMTAPPRGVEAIEFSSGGLRLSAWLAFPDRAPPKSPLVLFLHGGFAFGAEDFDMARPFLRAGFGVMTPILRGENGQGGAFSLFYDEVEDVLAAAAHARAHPLVDPARIYLAGHSVGGTMAMLSSMAAETPFKAVASFSGSPDQVAWIGGTRDDIVPFDAKDPQEFELRSPLAFPASLRSPTRLFFGSREGFFRQPTQQLVKLAKAAGQNVEGQEFRGDHFSAVPAAITASIALFKAHL